jgi:NADH dehydrogenase [ubiquinone] 1 alpha subcomplex assembly factor 1
MYARLHVMQVYPVTMFDQKIPYRMRLLFVSLLLLSTMTYAQLLDFTDARALHALWVVNDGVMGGVSQSRVNYDPEGAVFEGKVSLENGGGFASVRSPIAIPTGTSALEVTIRGDKKHYKLLLRTDSSPRSPLYQADFSATDDWKTHRFQASDFKASFRGRPVVAPELVFSDVHEIGVMIANQQAGTFRIQLKSVQSVGNLRH